MSIRIGQQPNFSSWAQGSEHTPSMANIYGNFTTGGMHYTALADDDSSCSKLVNVVYQGNRSKIKSNVIDSKNSS